MMWEKLDNIHYVTYIELNIQWPQVLKVVSVLTNIQLINPWEMWLEFLMCNFQTQLSYWYLNISCEIAFLCEWHGTSSIDVKTALVQIKIWCCRLCMERGHCLNHCWAAFVMWHHIIQLWIWLNMPYWFAKTVNINKQNYEKPCACFIHYDIGPAIQLVDLYLPNPYIYWSSGIRILSNINNQVDEFRKSWKIYCDVQV